MAQTAVGLSVSRVSVAGCVCASVSRVSVAGCVRASAG